MARRGGWMPGKPAVVLAMAVGVTASTGGLGALVAAARPTAGHGAHVLQDRLPTLPVTAPRGTGRYAPNVCHPNTERPASEQQLRAWIQRAGVLLHRPYSPGEVDIVLVVIDGESEGRVHAINCWDRNWREGHPTMGLMQDRDDTYMAHAPAGCRRLVLIYDGPCNIAASTHYALGRYGSLANIPGVGEVQAGGAYHSGY